jgi:stalled ribosome alternative rescue factor ArfA
MPSDNKIIITKKIINRQVYATLLESTNFHAKIEKNKKKYNRKKKHKNKEN